MSKNVSPQSLRGTSVAIITPFKRDYSLDEKIYRKHIRYLTRIKGIKCIFANAYAGEGSALTREERNRVLEITMEEVRGEVLGMGAVVCDDVDEAVKRAKDVLEIGGDGILLQAPPELLNAGTKSSVKWLKNFVKKVDIPVVLFQRRREASASFFLPQTLAKLVEIENVIAVKEAPFNQAQHEADCLAIRKNRLDIAILVASDNIIFSCMSFDSDGTLLGIGNILGPELVKLHCLVKDGAYENAKRLWISKINPITSVIWPYIYTPSNIWGKVKWLLHLTGKLDDPIVRPPERLPNEKEKEELKRALLITGHLKS